MIQIIQWYWPKTQRLKFLGKNGMQRIIALKQLSSVYCEWLFVKKSICNQLITTGTAHQSLKCSTKIKHFVGSYLCGQTFTNEKFFGICFDTEPSCICGKVIVYPFCVVCVCVFSIFVVLCSMTRKRNWFSAYLFVPRSCSHKGVTFPVTRKHTHASLIYCHLCQPHYTCLMKHLK